MLPGEQVRVAAGPLKLTVSVADLRAAPQLVSAPRPSPRSVRSQRVEAPSESPLPTRDSTCDLRGLRVDDAIAMATTFLDRALSEGLHTVFLLHGHGTGALRDALRKELAQSKYVARVAGAAANQGGEGVTLVWLA